MPRNLFKRTLEMGLICFFAFGCHRTDEGNPNDEGDLDSDADSETADGVDSDTKTGTDLDTNTEQDTNTDQDTETVQDTDTVWDTETGDEGILSECKTSEDCQLVNDCCNCLAIRNDQSPPDCELEECYALSCELYRFVNEQKVDCIAGRCVLNVSCDGRRVLCNTIEPECPGGQKAVVDPDGLCWTGRCLDVTQCSAVSSCEDCEANQPCVEYMDGGGTTHHCVINKPDCEDDITCKCMGESVCTKEYYECFEGAENLSCECINC